MRTYFFPRLVVATLAAAILITPLPASAVRLDFGAFGSMFESSWGSIAGWTGELLQHLWAREGISIDPLGRPEAVPGMAPEGVRHLWADEGISIDPLGRQAPAPAATTGDDRQ
ncbi:MAG: hypothetical protein ABJC13_12255 [Acidobacteriota bacterium]